MTIPKTLLEIAGADLQPASLETSTLVLIDLQNEYFDGPLKLPSANLAVKHASNLLNNARAVEASIIHIAHTGKPGGLFDRKAHRGQIAEACAPTGSERVIEKTLPNAFANTDLDKQLKNIGHQNIILAGFMTHMCISSTARAALDLGYRCTIDASSCATRDLPNGTGGIISAEVLHEATMAALSDRFAVIARSG